MQDLALATREELAGPNRDDAVLNGDGLVKRDWFRFYDQPPRPGPGHLVVQSWDIAMMTREANDYSVCTTWCMIKADYYLIDVFRARLQRSLHHGISAASTSVRGH